jgi:hypothetical protein
MQKANNEKINNEKANKKYYHWLLLSYFTFIISVISVVFVKFLENQLTKDEG